MGPYFTSSWSSSSSAPNLRIFPTPDEQAYGHYGQSVATSPGNLMVVGAGNETVGDLVGAGRVWTFATSAATLHSNLTSPNSQVDGHFGQSVAISPACDGTPCREPWVKNYCIIDACTLVVGASNETVNGELGAGRAYIFNSNTSALVQALSSPLAQSGGGFGYSVAASGKLVAIGAPNENVGGVVGAGRVYVYNAVTGKMMFNLTSPSTQLDGHFGFSVSMSDNGQSTGALLVVGAPGQTVNGHGGAGQAYIFSTKTGKLKAAFHSPHTQTSGSFGWSVSLTNYIVAVGAPRENSNGFHSAGNAYIFNATSGRLTYSLKSPNAQTSGYFGWSIWMSEQTLVVGAPNETADGFSRAGHVYTFKDATGSLNNTYTSLNVWTNGLFGYSVTVVQGPGYTGFIIGIGAPDENVSGYVASGRLYV